MAPNLGSMVAAFSRAFGPWIARTQRVEVTSTPGSAEVTPVVFEALGITSNSFSPIHQTMMSSTTKPSSLSRCVY